MNKTIRTEIFTRLEHHFNDDWTLSAAYSYRFGKAHNHYGMGGTSTINVDGSTALVALKEQFHPKEHSFDLHLDGKYPLFGRQHEMQIGVSHNAYKYRLQHGAFILIGADSSSYMRNGGYGTAISINFPARKIKATGYIPVFEEENGATPQPQQDRWTTLKSHKTYTLAQQPPEPYDLLKQSDPRLLDWLSQADGRSE